MFGNCDDGACWGTGNSFASIRLQCRPKAITINAAAIQNPIICSAAPFLGGVDKVGQGRDAKGGVSGAFHVDCFADWRRNAAAIHFIVM